MFYAFIRGDEMERERRIVRSLVGAGAAGSISANRIFSLPKNVHPHTRENHLDIPHPMDHDSVYRRTK